MKEQTLEAEQVLLRSFGFDLDVKHPHYYVLHFVRDLEGMNDGFV